MIFLTTYPDSPQNAKYRCPTPKNVGVMVDLPWWMGGGVHGHHASCMLEPSPWTTPYSSNIFNLLKSSSSGNRTLGVCVTGRNVTNYTNEELDRKGTTRFELVTAGSAIPCSTAELSTHIYCCDEAPRAGSAPWSPNSHCNVQAPLILS